MRKTFDEMTPAERASHIEEMAKDLVELAEEVGVVVQITHRPRKPLAMGNFDHALEVRPALAVVRAQN